MPRSPAADSGTDQVRGLIERITFHNAENGYTIAKLMPERGRDLVTIIGTFTNPVVGESLVCEGTWSRHPEWGLQLNVQHYETVRPATAPAIEKYLGSGMIKGLGPSTARRIVQRFGESSLDVIDTEPSKLLTIAGIGDKLLARIKEAWSLQREIRNIMVFLQSHGVSPLMSDRIYKTYKDRAISVVESNPYRLAYDIWGVGFASADKIARNMGIAFDDPRRIQAGLIYCMNEAVERSGNVYLTRALLAAAASDILGTREIDAQLAILLAAGQLVEVDVPFSDETAIYLPQMLNMERALCERMRELLDRPKPGSPAPTKIERVLSRLKIELSEEQRSAVDVALTSRVMVLTGGPGTGKTTSTRAIIAAFHEVERRVKLASPTGRAAKRLNEVTGVEALTVHRLLAFDPATRQFMHGPGAPIDCDMLLLDEASMLDLPLAHAVFRALPDSAQIILVGDVDQLPSVGPGNILRDVIESGCVPVVRLTTIFRQAAQSNIVVGAHAINSGRMPELASPRELDRDFVFVSADDAEELATKIVGVVSVSLPKRGIPPGDIQVLTPMQRGSAGAAYLNQRLQQALNPKDASRPEAQRGGRTLRLGDRVIQIRNNYDKNIFNGDVGAVVAVNTEGSEITVRFADVEINYDYSELDELMLAYALSIHKSQGSEFPAVVIALHPQHYTLLQRQLIYTALTRARRFAVLVGSKKAVAIAVRNDRQNKRLTLLRERLQGLV
jgi:exodeoxyribonuclease V alpha subunit